MKKNWILLSIPFLFNLLSCEGLSMGGNGEEVKDCTYVLREHATTMYNNLEIRCLYNSNCSIIFHFGPAGSSKDINACGNYEYKFINNEKTIIVQKGRDFNKPSVNADINLIPDSDEHVRFSLFDIKNVEKKYDFDLSGIIHSFTVRGDSIDVNVMKDCRMDLYSCQRETVYGNELQDGKYTFSVNEGCKDYYRYRCSWHNQSSLETDDLDISAAIYWK
jgi:hypothetical protein